MLNKLIVILVLFAVTISCKDNQKKDIETTSEEQPLVAEDGKTLKQSDGLIAIHGNYLYVAEQNAAVLQTPTQMYSIVTDDKLKALNAQVEPLKTDVFTMVPVTIRGRIFKKDSLEEGWENKIEIKEILKVSPPEPEDNDIIKLGNK